jgi:hypothetical protein
MAIDLSFRDIRRFVEKDQPKELLPAVDKLMGLAIISLPIALGPAALPALGLLQAKDELVKLGSSLLDSITKKKDTDFIRHQERMETAYALICYTAFFDALDHDLPDDIREGIALQSSEKEAFARHAAEDTCDSVDRVSKVDPDAEAEAPLPKIPYPHPAESPKAQEERLSALYSGMAHGFLDFVKSLSYWEELKEADKKRVATALAKVEKDAIRFYRLQYGDLCRQSTSFSIWANLNEHQLTKKQVAQLSDTVKNLYAMSQKSIDIGFGQLQEVVRSIPKTLEVHQATQIAEALGKHYQARIDELIVEDTYYTEEGKPSLSFPRIRDAFIPQSFKVIRKAAKGLQLETPETWDGIQTRNDLGAFILSYLDSPYSTEAPMVILGHPGSGKSLLTKVLAATLISEQFTSVRVQLRNVDADTLISNQIQRGIEEITGENLDSWASFARQFQNCPPVVILDGYDELLQASGKVFASYLQQIQDFQARETEQGRPVRVIVTSRLTLIDKATVPEGATIIRLMEFDAERRQKWIGIWNNVNRLYFNQCEMKPFELPQEGASDNESILALAKQPLLLLMLALYDSDGNQLKHSKGLDRTVLYDNLLRRFVWREHAKEAGFPDRPQTEQDDEVDRDMQRLGVAAMGMYNRRKLHIVSEELEKDLKFFTLEREVKEKDGRQMTQADMLLGSFFFVHKSKAQQKMDNSDGLAEVAAFEFLHNTFGEFLTADFILRQLFLETTTIRDLAAKGSLRAVLDQRLNTADEFSDAWYSCLAYTPLFERPVVLEMLMERASHLLRCGDLERKVFLQNFDSILKHHITQVLDGREMASIMCGSHQTSFGALPLLGHLATYSLNLIILRTVLSDGVYEFREECFDSKEDGARMAEDESGPRKDRSRPWDRLAHIWQSWFPLDRLSGLAAVISSKRDNTVVHITPKATLGASTGGTRLESVLNVSLALGDSITAGITGLLTHQGRYRESPSLEDIEGMLACENITPFSQILLRRVQSVVYDGAYEYREEDYSIVRELLNDAIERLPYEMVPNDLRTAITILMHVRPYRHDFETQELLDRLFHRLPLMETVEQYPDLAVEWLRFARETGNRKWIKRGGPEWLDRLFHGMHPMEAMDRYPELALELLRFARETGNHKWMEHFGREWLDRFLHRMHPMEAVERYPELALELLRFTRETGNREWMHRFGEAWMDRFFHEMHPLEAIERCPELALELLRLARETGNRGWMERFGMKSSRAIQGMLRTAPFALVGELYAWARESGNAEVLDIIEHELRHSYSSFPLDFRESP